MSPRSEAISEIQRLLKSVPDEIEIVSQLYKMEQAAFDGLDANTTRSTILIAVGMLEHALAVAIGAHFTDHKPIRQKIFDGDGEREGIIGTIYTRNVVAHALDVYGADTYADINAIRLIRNVCAHAKSEVDFSIQRLKPLSEFNGVNAIVEKFQLDPLPKRLTPQSPVHGMMMFLQYLMPYLLLHGSPGYIGTNNYCGWREVFV